jgi:hypothetical protein
MKMPKPPNNPTMADLLKVFKEDVFYDLNCVQIGEIINLNAQEQTAEIEIKNYPLLLDCPGCF